MRKDLRFLLVNLLMGEVFPKRVLKVYKFSKDSFFKLFHEGHEFFTCSTQVILLYVLLSSRGTSCMIKMV